MVSDESGVGTNRHGYTDREMRTIRALMGQGENQQRRLDRYTAQEGVSE